MNIFSFLKQGKCFFCFVFFTTKLFRVERPEISMIGLIFLRKLMTKCVCLYTKALTSKSIAMQKHWITPMSLNTVSCSHVAFCCFVD